LNGDIILVKGNHDVLPIDVYKAIFNDVVEDVYIKELNIYMSHFPSNEKMIEMMNNDALVIYGHVHENVNVFPNYGKTFCSCVERNNNTPVLLSHIIEIRNH